MSTSRLKLQYLPIQGRAEGIRMLLLHSNIEFEDSVLEFDVFARAKGSGDLPYGQLPVLLVDERPIAQTGSILRYIDKLSGANQIDDVVAAQADAAFEAAQEMPMAQIYVAVNLMAEAEAKETARAFKAALPQYMKHWSKCLQNRKFFHGQVPGYADFFIWALLDTAKGFVPDMFKEFTSMKQWSVRVRGLPAVTKYITTRPRVRDVTKWKLCKEITGGMRCKRVGHEEGFD